MSEVTAKGEDWRDDWRLVPEVPREACWWGRWSLPGSQSRAQVEDQRL